MTSHPCFVSFGFSLPVTRGQVSHVTSPLQLNGENETANFPSKREFKANTMAFEYFFYDNCATSYWRKTEALTGGNWPDLRGHLLTFGGMGMGIMGIGFQNSL